MEANRRLRRPVYPMPDDVQKALESRSLVEEYNARPDYQRNDYLGWMLHAKRVETRQKRLAQMLDELERGGVYMNMAWHPR
jgi:uncharacterized protein YdeI (YjbR/CyaY-like superfamily)